MKKGILMIALLLVAVPPAAAQKVTIDYDKEADFTKFETYAWKATPEVSLADTSPLMHSRIQKAIEYQLTQGGLAEDTDDPDLYVTYYAEEKTQYRIHTSNFGYDYSRSWHRGGYWGTGTSTSTVTSYPEGTLVIDLWDAREGKAIWRGTATAVVPSNPEKAARKIDEAVTKIARRWEKMRRRGR